MIRPICNRLSVQELTHSTALSIIISMKCKICHKIINFNACDCSSGPSYDYDRIYYFITYPTSYSNPAQRYANIGLAHANSTRERYFPAEAHDGTQGSVQIINIFPLMPENELRVYTGNRPSGWSFSLNTSNASAQTKLIFQMHGSDSGDTFSINYHENFKNKNYKFSLDKLIFFLEKYLSPDLAATFSESEPFYISLHSCSAGWHHTGDVYQSLAARLHVMLRKKLQIISRVSARTRTLMMGTKSENNPKSENNVPKISRTYTLPQFSLREEYKEFANSPYGNSKELLENAYGSKVIFFWENNQQKAFVSGKNEAYDSTLEARKKAVVDGILKIFSILMSNPTYAIEKGLMADYINYVTNASSNEEVNSLKLEFQQIQEALCPLKNITDSRILITLRDFYFL